MCQPGFRVELLAKVGNRPSFHSTIRLVAKRRKQRQRSFAQGLSGECLDALADALFEFRVTGHS